jgi:hypothetical protein
MKLHSLLQSEFTSSCRCRPAKHPKKPAGAVQGLSAVPTAYTLWYLYCETATQHLEAADCRHIFKQAFKQLPSCVACDLQHTPQAGGFA